MQIVKRFAQHARQPPPPLDDERSPLRPQRQSKRASSPAIATTQIATEIWHNARSQHLAQLVAPVCTVVRARARALGAARLNKSFSRLIRPRTWSARARFALPPLFFGVLRRRATSSRPLVLRPRLLVGTRHLRARFCRLKWRRVGFCFISFASTASARFAIVNDGDLHVCASNSAHNRKVARGCLDWQPRRRLADGRAFRSCASRATALKKAAREHKPDAIRAFLSRSQDNDARRQTAASGDSCLPVKKLSLVAEKKYILCELARLAIANVQPPSPVFNVSGSCC